VREKKPGKGLGHIGPDLSCMERTLFGLVIVIGVLAINYIYLTKLKKANNILSPASKKRQ
jgi:hypothetical protein